MTTPAAMTTAVYQTVQKYWAYTSAVYGLDTDPTRTPLAVGSAVPVTVKGFESTAGSGFGGALYKNEVTGQYTLAYVGSELKDFVPDWLKADGTLAMQDLFNAARNFVGTWNPQFTDAMNFAYAAVKQIHTDLQKQGIENPSMTDIRARLDVTGHSLGGALAELVGKLFGLKGVNIDGPGVSVLTQDPNFTRFIADKLLSDNSLPASLKAGMVEAVVRNPGDFVAAGFSFVSMAGEHLSEAGYAAEADAARAYYAGTLNILGGLGVSVLNPGAGVWMIGSGLVSLAKDGSNHPGSAIIRRTENALEVQPMDALKDASTVDPWQVEGAAQWALFQKTPSATTYGVFVGWLAETRAGNIEKGLSPSGLAINGDVQRRGGQNVRAVLLDDGTIREIATPVDGGSPSYKDFKVMPDGQVGLVKPNGSIEFLIAQRGDGGGVSLGAVMNLRSDNKLVITPLGQARMVSEVFELSSAEATAIRAGNTTAKGVFGDRLEAIFDFAADPTGHPMAANQIEYNGHLYNAHGANGYIRALGEGYSDVIEASGARYLLDALGNRTPVGPDQTIVLSDTGLPSVASAYRPDAAPVGAGTKLVLTQGTVVKQFEIDANGKVTRTTETQTFDGGDMFEHKSEGGKNYIRAIDDEGHVGEWREYKTVAQIARDTHFENELYSDMAGFLNALRGKDKVNQLLYGAKMVIDYQMKNGATEVKLGDLDLGKTVAGLSATVGIVAGLHALQSDDTQTQLSGAVGLLGSANSLAVLINGGDLANQASVQANGFLSGPQLQALQTAGAVLALANLKNLDSMLEHGQVGSAAATMVGAINAGAYLAESATALAGEGALIAINPVVAVIAVVFLDSVFGDDDPPPPPVGWAEFAANSLGQIAVKLHDTNDLGAGILQSKMAEILTSLNQQLQEANTPAEGQTHDSARDLVLVASRMPKLYLQSWPSHEGNGETNYYYYVEMTHPQTGQKYGMQIARQDVAKQYASLLVAPEALVQKWQAVHMAAKFGADDSQWQTEGQWTTAQSPIEQQRQALTKAYNEAAQALKTAQQDQLTDDGQGNVSYVNGQTPEQHQTLVSVAQAKVDAAYKALVLFSAEHPLGYVDEKADTNGQHSEGINPQAAAMIVDAQTAAGFAQLKDKDPIAWQTAWSQARQNATQQWMKVIALDWDGDGLIQKITAPQNTQTDLRSLQTDGVARFDVDNDGYREVTQWVAASDAMLGIDRDGNGVIDTASELFNGPNTVFEQRGWASLKYYDSNKDGKITQADAVWKLLRLWVDINGDGAAGSMETFTLDMDYAGVDMAKLKAGLDAAGQQALVALKQMAVGSIDLATLKFNLADGSTLQAHDEQLQADVLGTAVTVEGEMHNPTVWIEQTKGEAERMSYAVVIDEISQLQELNKADLSTVRREELLALAKKYGLDPSAPEFSQMLKNVGAAVQTPGAPVTVGPNGITVGNVPPVLQQLYMAAVAQQGQWLVVRGQVFGSDTVQAPIWATSRQDAAVFDDHYVTARKLSAGEITSDAVVNTATPVTVERWVLPSSMYSLDNIAQGAQQGGLVQQQAVVVSQKVVNGVVQKTAQQQVQVYTTATPTETLAGGTYAGREDEALMLGYVQLERDARLALASTDPTLSFKLLGVREVRHGSVLMDDAAGLMRFVPDADYSGKDAGLTYVLADAQGRIYARRVDLNLTEVNDAPTVLGETIATTEDVPIVINPADLLANDSDKEGDALTIIGIGRTGMGHATMEVNGQIRYVPPSNLYGVTDTVEYLVQDARGGVSVGVIKINLAAAADAPTVRGEVIRNAQEDVTLHIEAKLLLANDFDPDVDMRVGGSPLHITAVGQAEHGQVFLDGQGDVYFVPELNFYGKASFVYTVTDAQGLSTQGRADIEIAASNDAPMVAGETVNALEDEQLIINPALLLANDSDVDVTQGGAQSLRIVSVHATLGGQVQQLGGKVVFTPDANYNGKAGFDYVVGDGAGGLALGHVDINIQAVNDAPVSVARTFDAVEDTPLKIRASQFLAGLRDVEDGTQLSLSVAALSGGGVSKAFDATLGEDVYTFTPNKNFNGDAQLTYTVSDSLGASSQARVTLKVQAVNDLPEVAPNALLVRSGTEDVNLTMALSDVLKLFTDPDGDALRVVEGSLKVRSGGDSVVLDGQSLIFKPQANFNGTTGFDFKLRDSQGGEVAAGLSIQLAAVNDLPEQLRAATGVGMEDQEVRFTQQQLLELFKDVDGDTLSLNLANLQALTPGATVRYDSATGQVVFKAGANFNGSTGFLFSVNDGHGGQVQTQMALNLAPVNDVPVLVNSDWVQTADEDQTVRVTVSSLRDLFRDDDGDVLALDVNSLRSLRGTEKVQYEADTQSVLFTPEANFNGQTGFWFALRDASNAKVTSFAKINLAAVNDAPLVGSKQRSGWEDYPITMRASELMTGVSDVEDAAGSLRLVGVQSLDDRLKVDSDWNASYGEVVYTFTPSANANGVMALRYTVADSQGAQASGDLSLSFVAVNDTPAAVARSFNTTEDPNGPLRIRVSELLAGIKDVEDGTQGLRVSVSSPASGTLTRAYDASLGEDVYTFTPAANMNGTLNLSYTVSDSQGASTSAGMQINVAAVNDAPSFIKGSYINQHGIEHAPFMTFNEADLLRMFVDPEGDAKQIDPSKVRALTGHDILDWNASTRQLIWKPESYYTNGTRQIEIAVKDSQGASSQVVRLDLQIDAVNDAPVCEKLPALWIQEDGGSTISTYGYRSSVYTADILKNFKDPEGDALRVVSIGNAMLNGQPFGVSFTQTRLATKTSSDRYFIQTPLNWYGTFYCDVTVADDKGASITRKIPIVVTAVDDVPEISFKILSIEANSFVENEREAEGRWTAYLANINDVDNSINDYIISINKHPIMGANPQFGKTLQYLGGGYCADDGRSYYFYKSIYAEKNYFIAPQYQRRKGSGSMEMPVSFEFKTKNYSGVFDFKYRFSWDPIIIDLNDDGLTFINGRDCDVAFDVDDDETKDRLAWMGKDEAMLVYDHDQDGQVIRFNELAFGTHLADPNPHLPDLQALARPEFDSNQDGVFDARDAKWSKFALWQDKDSDGVVDVGEMQSLDAAGVSALALHANVLNHAYGPDVTVRGFTRVTMKDGKQLQAGDVYLSVYDPSSDTSTADPNAVGSEAQWIDPAQAQALTDAWQRSLDAQLHAGSTRFAGSAPSDVGHKALVDQLYSFVLPDAWLAQLPVGGQVQVLQQDGSALPSWLSYDAASHTLGGTPALTAQGLLNVQIRLLDAAGVVRGSHGYALEVAHYNQAPEVYGDMPVLYAAEEQFFDVDIAPNFFIDRDASDRLSLALTMSDGKALPNWLHFDAANLRVYGTPAQQDVGALHLRLTATDSAQASASETFTLQVSNTNDAPELVSALKTFGLRSGQSSTYVLPLTAFYDADVGIDDKESLTLGVSMADGSALPEWLSYTTATHTLVATLQDGQSIQPLQLRVTATDFSWTSVSTFLTVAMGQWGTLGNDHLLGSSVAEYLWGEAGNDQLDGGAGADILCGGQGDDVYVVDVLDTVIEKIGEGSDTVISQVSFVLPENVENLRLQGVLTINGTGNDLANVLIGNGGDNILNGMGGVDALIGGGGNDIYRVDSVSDVIIEDGFGGVDTVESSVTYSLSLVNNVENLRLVGNLSINGTGNYGDNHLFGNAADNVLIGAGGNDVLNGGGGKDILIGGDGSDTYIINDLLAVIVENDADSGVDAVLSSVDFDLSNLKNVENLSLMGDGSINGFGNNLNNYLRGNSGNNVLSGGAGNDVLVGCGGVDRLIGGSGDDTYYVNSSSDEVVELAGEGEDTIISSTSFSLENYSNVERLVLNRGEKAVGNEMNNVLIGNDASNVLDGRGGADVLVGGLGDDVYVFGMVCGKDVVQDSDPQFGGVDTIRFDESVSASDLSLGRSGNDLLIFLGNGENQISVTGCFEGWANQIEKIQFANGLEWGFSEINQKSLSNDVGDGYWASVTLSPGQTIMQEILINPGGVSSFPTDHDTYIVSLTAGKTYQFDQVSRSGSQLDCFLELIDWNVVAVVADDDGGGNLNSRIVFTPNSSGDYYLDASSLTGTGYYSITMTEVNPQSVIGSNIFNVDAVVEYVKAVKDPNFYGAVWSIV